MNSATHELNKEASDFEQRARQLLHDSVERLPAETRSRLTRARYAALSSRPSWQRNLARRWVPAGAGALAAAVFAVLFIVVPRSESPAVNPLASAAPEDLEMLADSPSNYLREPDAMEFLAPIPSVWDDTRVLDARIADYVAVARRSGRDWYVGAMNDWTARELEIDLSFLPEGDFAMTSYWDGVNADRYGSDYRMEKKIVNRSMKIKIKLAPGGGWAARIVPQ